MALTRITKGVIKPNENYDTHNINSTGIVTAVGANFTGNVSVGGTLTYEDVTSIDSVGIITAQNGIDCNGDLDVDGHTNLDNVSIAGVTTFSGGNGAATIGSNSDLRFVNGSNYGTEAPKLTLNNNSLYLQGGSSGIVIRTLAGNNRFWFNGDHFLPVVDSTSDLGTNSTRFRNVYADTFVGNANIGIITSTSIDLNGDIDVDGHTNLDNVSIAGVTTTTDEIKILTDNKSIVFGASSDLSMKHDGTNSYILNNTGSFIISADTLQFNNRANNQTKAKFVNNGAAELYHNGTRMFRTTAEGVIVSNIPNNHGLDLNGVGNNTCIRFTSTGSSPGHAYRINYHSVTNNIFNSPCISFDKTATNGNFDSHIAAISDTGFHLADNKKLHVGGTTNASSANGDLQIYHSSSDNNSYIKEVGSGALVINADDFYLQNVATTTSLRTHSSGAIDLNHSGNKKLETTNTGVKITSSANGDGINILSGNNSNTIYLDANRSGANNGIGQIAGRWNGTTVAQVAFNTGSDTTDKNDGYIWFGTESAASNGNVNATERLRITSNGQVNIAPNNLDQTAYKVQIETGANRFLSIKTANHNDFSDEGSGIFFSRQSDGSKELSGIFAHTNTSLGMASRKDLTFHAGGSGGYSQSPERLRIDSSGNVGIASASPNAPLDVFKVNGTIAVFGDSRSGSFESIAIKNNIAGYPAITNDSTPDTLELRSFGSVQATIDSNNNSTGKYFRVMNNGQGGAGAELFRVDDSGKVGIGTDNPASPLQIVSSANNIVQIRSTTRYSTMYMIDSIGSSFIQNDSGHLRFGTGGSANASGGEDERLRITSAGDMGMDTSPQNYSNYKTFTVGAGSVGSIIALRGATSNFQHLIQNNNGSLLFEADVNNTSATTDMIFKIDGSQKFIITSNGNVSIDGGDLTFGGNNHKILTGSSAHMITIQGGASNPGGRIELRGGNSSGDIRMFAQGATSTAVERLRISSGGQIGIGQDGSGNVNTRAVLEINAPFNDVSDNDGSAAYTMNNHDAILINYSGASYSSGTNVGSIAWTNGGRRRAAIMAEYQSTDGDIVALSFFTRGTDGAGDFYRSFIINRNGSAGLHGTLATSTSDDRLKKDKVEITNALDKVNSLSSFTHKWNDIAVRAGLEEDKEEIGLSAQEVQGLYPCLVDVNNVMKDPEDPDTDYLTVHYAKVVPLLVASIKELTAKNKALEARLDALESS